MAKMILLNLVLLLMVSGAPSQEEASEKAADLKRRLEMLRSVPYVSLAETVADESQSGVVLYNPEETYDGYNLYTTAFSGEAFLLDMEGHEVHRWKYPPRRVGIGSHAELLENGDLMVAKSKLELLRLNWVGEVIWRKDLRAHHEVAQVPDGSFYVLTMDQKNHRGMKVRFDDLVHLTADGVEIERWSSYDRLSDLQSVLDTRSFLDTVLDSALGGQLEYAPRLERIKGVTGGKYWYDYFHMNAVSVLPATVSGERDSRFRPGNLLVCFRNVNQIAVLEKDTYRVLWAWGEGELEWPHHPTMLSSGHILIFDNGAQRKYSRVVELDPVTEAIVWEYTAEPPEDFYSRTRGSAQRFPNGNTLICESDNGRAFEVTREGELVWMWLNPNTNVPPRMKPAPFPRWRHRETVYRMMRLPLDQVDRLLGKTGAQGNR